MLAGAEETSTQTRRTGQSPPGTPGTTFPLIKTLSMMSYVPDEARTNESLWGDPRGYEFMQKERAATFFEECRQQGK